MSTGYCRCPECKKWVPEDMMVRDYDDDGQLIRVCSACLEGTSDQNDFVYDPDFGKVKCIYCRSLNTIEQAPNWNYFKCNSCNRTFRRM